MSDHLIVIDAPVTDAQSNWTIAAAQAKYPGKPIRYLVLTHHHMDHAGGYAHSSPRAPRSSSARARARISAGCSRRR